MADRPAPYRPAPAPAYQPAPSYDDTPPVYAYAYAVQDDYANVDFNANEEREGSGTKGGYTVLLPDGRTQTVTYTVQVPYRNKLP